MYVLPPHGLLELHLPVQGGRSDSGEENAVTKPQAPQQVQILSQEEPEMNNPGTEVDKAQARLETAEEILKLAQSHLLEVEKRCGFYRRELRRIIGETFTKGEPA